MDACVHSDKTCDTDVQDLKQECEQRGVSMVGLAEKSEIIEALQTVRKESSAL